MLKWLFLAQAVVYLLIMPWVRSTVEIGYYPSIGSAFLTIASILVGVWLFRWGAADKVRIGDSVARLHPSTLLTVGVTAMAVVYSFTAFSFGLLNRRQGSEFMAELYADLPLWALAVVRSYEIAFIPIALFYAFAGSNSKIGQWVVGVALLASLPFMGLADSRGRLLVMAVYFLCFIRPKTVIEFLYRNARFYVAAIGVFGTFLFFSFRRSQEYASMQEYLLLEVYRRLDGLNLVTDLRDAGFLDKVGSFDWNMFSPLLSRIPFLEAAEEAKRMGRTSTKQYYTQDLLGTGQLDTSNSLITDPLYFAGWAGIAICFGAIGYVIAKSDDFVARGCMFKNAVQTASAIALVTSFAIFENDMVGSILTFAQNFLFAYLILALGAQRREASQSAATMPAAIVR